MTQKQNGVIDLHGKPVLRKSRNHLIFDHPFFEGALLKVRSDTPTPRRFFKRYSEFRYGNLRQWNREANEYLAALHRGCPEIDRLAGFHGFARTTLGPALVVEKLTGPDGKLAPTVEEELGPLSADSPDRKAIERELVELVDMLDRAHIIVGDFSFNNIVRAQERGGKLTVIDGLGERVLIPLTLFSKTFFRFSLSRRRSRNLLDRL